ncbi:MAG TPA: hypothetical protein VHZ97_10500 [Pseudonocardiaceae bacterium]|nr:hypothetical protein [Pseudonocardiaceae bacterium]
MTVAKPAVRQALPYAAVGLVVIAVAVFALWLLAGFSGMRSSADTGTTVPATVTKTAPCASATPNDVLTAQVGGKPLALLLNGCGNSPGTKVTVLVPSGSAANTVVNQTSAAPGTASGLSHRVAFLLLVVAAAAGGGFGYLLYRQRPEPSTDAARPAAKIEPFVDERPSSPVANNTDTGTNWFEDSGIHDGFHEALNTAPEPENSAQENAEKS